MTLHPLVQWRLDAGLSQRSMAMLLQVSQGYLSRVERGRVKCSVAVARTLQRQTGLSLDEILAESDPPPRVHNPRARRGE